MGFLTAAEAKKQAAQPCVARKAASRARSGRRRPAPAVDPQQILAQALKERLGSDAVQEEVTGLVPGRAYRVDMLLPASGVVIEFDGFQYHRSKAAFQKDRERQNRLVREGYRVLRYFNRQVRDGLEEVVQEVVEIHGRFDRKGDRSAV
ncbi:protein of unknown function DUF559 (plasmid) [Thioalkalivibrio sp. K90mix]|nr:protein of unknown function DUF559 [Thioalkalivibrio sp. K90mix]